MGRFVNTMWGAVGIGALFVSAVASAHAVELKNLPANVHFVFSASNPKVQTLGGTIIGCKGVSGSGEFTSERLGAAEFKFTECTEPVLKVSCTGLGDTTSGSITMKGEFHTRHLLPEGEGVNVAVLVVGAHFLCFGILFSDSGCAATMDLLSSKGGTSIVGVLRSSVYAAFLQTSGDASPVSIDTDNSLGMESCEIFGKQEEKAATTYGLLAEGTIEQFRNSKGEETTELVDLTGTP
jgi:hypothetical protein